MAIQFGLSSLDGSCSLLDTKIEEIKTQNKFVYDDKVFHSEFGFGYVTSTDNEIVEVFFEDDLKKRKVNKDTLKRF